MTSPLFSVTKALQLFDSSFSVDELVARTGKDLPPFSRSQSTRRQMKSWDYSGIVGVGEKIGFLAKPKTPQAIAVFVTKGGVLKTSLTLNIARAAALHGIKTCVVGLDMQADITTALGFGKDSDDAEDLSEALQRANSVRGLADIFAGNATLEETILATDIPTLSFIPETPELVALDQGLINKNRREYWLREKIVQPLKERFDLVLMDCSPNWNRLITNALVASDLLISPVECKINNFRNLKVFRALLAEFKFDLDTNFEHIFVPTRLTASRKLSAEIFSWYRAHLPGCTANVVRECLQGEEATALALSTIEFAPASAAAQELRSLLTEIWTYLLTEERRPPVPLKTDPPVPKTISSRAEI